MKKDYIINENTLYLEYLKEREIVVHELSTNKVITGKSMKTVINDSCLYYGSSYTGRMNSSKDYLNELYKLPIFINESKKLVAFPLNSVRTKTATWIIYNNIKSYQAITKNKVLVEFKNGKKATFPISYYIFHNQILKCSRLLVIYQSRNQIFF